MKSPIQVEDTLRVCTTWDAGPQPLRPDYLEKMLLHMTDKIDNTGTLEYHSDELFKKVIR